jgi:hypothetical protein
VNRMEYTDEQIAGIRDSITKILPMGTPFILVFDGTTSEELIDNVENNIDVQDFVKVVGKYQSPFLTRGLLEAASDSYRFLSSDCED